MADITMCATKSCPIKEICYRSQAKPSEYHQSYCDFSNEIVSGECPSFIAISVKDKNER